MIGAAWLPDDTIAFVDRSRLARVAADGKSVELVVEGMVQGHVHDFFLGPMRSESGEELLHSSAYYTLNEIPATSKQ